jgi:ParB family transcriptional regulator, chromosome partitioning protein
MQFNDEIQKVSLSQIKLDEETYRITTQKDIDRLTTSIDSLGIIHPPILKELNSTEFLIIAGFRRILAASALGCRELSVRVLRPDTENLACSLLAIADNSLERQLNLIELSKSFYLLSRHTTDQDKLTDFASALNLPHNPGYYNKLMAIGRLPQTIQEGIVNEDIALPNALLLEKMSSKDAISISDLFKNLNFSLSKQREIIVLSNEIAIREDMTSSDVINSSGIQDTIANPEWDQAHKAKKIREYLKARRFPNLMSAQNQFANVASSLALNPNLKLSPPPNFEGNKFTLTLSFKDTADLTRLQSSISKLLLNPKLINYFKTR